jgi:excisionase family DNA binding protein
MAKAALLLAHQAARLLGCTPSNVRWLARSGKLRFTRAGHVRLYAERDVLAFRKRRQRAKAPGQAPAEPAPAPDDGRS